MPSKAAQPKDFFAEQNKKQAEKEQKFKKIRKRVLFIGAPVVAVTVVVIATLMVTKMLNPEVIVTEEPRHDGVAGTQLTAVLNLSEQATEAFEPSYSVGEDGDITIDGDREAAESTFAAALDNPANSERTDTVYVAKIVFYASIGDYQRIIETAQNVEPDRLNQAEKIEFYNQVYLAYAALGNSASANYYYKLAREASTKVGDIGG